MRIGLPKETKDGECRVGLTPANVKELIAADHEVFVEENAGEGSGFSAEDYHAAGARLVKEGTVYDGTELIVKVKEPSAAECDLMHPGQIIFAFLHLAACPNTLAGLLRSRVTAIAYENVKRNNYFPLVAPMSIIAGKLSIQTGAWLVAKHAGVLLSEYYGLPSSNVIIIGAGQAGTAAMNLAVAMGAKVKVFDVNEERLAVINHSGHDGIPGVTGYHVGQLHKHLHDASLIVGAVLRPGERAPIVLKGSDIKSLKRGTVFIDIAIDQGGCSETSQPTSHSDPTYEVDGVVHYCVPNMPGQVPRTSTLALTEQTMPYIKLLANFDSMGGSWQDLKPAVAVRAGQIVDERLKLQ